MICELRCFNRKLRCATEKHRKSSRIKLSNALNDHDQWVKSQITTELVFGPLCKCGLISPFMCLRSSNYTSRIITTNFGSLMKWLFVSRARNLILMVLIQILKARIDWWAWRIVGKEFHSSRWRIQRSGGQLWAHSTINQ